MVSSFDPHSMCAEFERITAKTGCTSCTNCTISFKARGFHTKTHLFQRHFIFLNLFQLKIFLHSTCTIQSHILKLESSHHFTHIACSKMIYFELLNTSICTIHFFFTCVLCLLRCNHGQSTSLNRMLGSALTLKGGIS